MRNQKARPGLSAEEEAQRHRDISLWGDRYFETQEDLKCGRHAVNNVMGGPQFVDADVHRAVDEVVSDVGESQDQHAGPRGWYSHSTLANQFELTLPCWVLQLQPAKPCDYDQVVESTNVCGILINIANAHWVCVCKEKGALFYVDSLHAPTIIGRSDFEQIITKYPMSFPVVTNEFVPRLIW